VSDKRLLERCGNGKGYLIETRSVSVRPPGLRTMRAEAWTQRTRRPRCSEDRRKPETFFQRLSHRASDYDGLRSRVIWNWCLILREISNSAWLTLRPRIPCKREKGQPEGSAVTGKTRKPWVAKKDPVSRVSSRS